MKKNLTREKLEYELFHLRIPIELAGLVRRFSDKSELSLNAAVVYLLTGAIYPDSKERAAMERAKIKTINELDKIKAE